MWAWVRGGPAVHLKAAEARQSDVLQGRYSRSRAAKQLRVHVYEL